MDNHNINKARIVYYGFFAAFFSFYLKEQHLAVIEQCIDLLSDNPIDEQTAKALAHIKRKLKKGGYTALKSESDQLFYSPAEAFIPLTASYYAEERDNGAKRMEMINYIAESNLRKNTDTYKEQEDHIEFVFLFIQRLLEKELNGDAQASMLMKKIFDNILNRLIEPLCDNLFAHEDSFIYQDVALALRSFTEFERFFLGVDAPKEEDTLPDISLNKKRKIPQGFYKKGHKECV